MSLLGNPVFYWGAVKADVHFYYVFAYKMSVLRLAGPGEKCRGEGGLFDLNPFFHECKNPITAKAVWGKMNIGAHI